MPSRHPRVATSGLAVLLALLAAAANAAEPTQPSLETAAARDAFIAVVAHAPSLQAAQARVRAARRRAGVAGALSDPRFVAEAMRAPRMAVHGLELDLEQELPRYGARTAARARAAAEADRAVAAHAGEFARVAGEAARLIATADVHARSAALVDNEVVRARELRQARLAAMAADGANADDILALRSRIDAAELEARDQRRQAEDAREAARALLGLAGDAPLPAIALPEPEDAEAERDPMVANARAEAAIARADAAAARAERRPGVTLGVGWQNDDLADDGSAAFTAMVGLSIPVNQRAARAAEDAALDELAAARRDEDAARARAGAMLARARRGIAQAHDARATAEEAAARLEAQLRAYCVAGAALDAQLHERGEAGLASLLEHFAALDGMRRRAIEAELAAVEAAADLWSFIPPPVP